MNKKKITSVALAFTLAVAAPVKANLISLDFGPAVVNAATATDPVKTAEEELNTAKQQLTEKTTAATNAQSTYTEKKDAAEKAKAALDNDPENGNLALAYVKASEEEEKAKSALDTANQEKEAAQALVDKKQAAYDKAVADKEAADKEAVAFAKAKTDLAAAIAKAEGQASAASNKVYTDASIKALKDAIVTAKEAQKGTTSKALNDAKAALEKVKLVEKSTTTPSTNPSTITITRFDRGDRIKYSDLDSSLPSGARIIYGRNSSSSDYITRDFDGYEVVYATVEFKDGTSKEVKFVLDDRSSSSSYDLSFNRPTVYSDRVTGRLSGSNRDRATVYLYERGRSGSLASARTDRDGDFTIYYNFGRNNGFSSNRYSTTSNYNFFGNYIEGRTSSNRDIDVYRNGSRIASGTSDRNGDYRIYVGNYSYRDIEVRVYDSGSSFSNLSNYYIEARYGSDYSERYYLDRAYTDSSYNRDAYTAKVTQATPGTRTVKGNGVNEYATVTVYDNNNNRLGSTTADRNGNFTVSLNRDLKSGETIKIETSSSNYRTVSTTYKVSGTASDTYNYTVTLAIGQKTLTTVKDGKTTTTTMDTEAYIKDGRTMLPIRFVAQALGYNVTWNDATRTAAFSDGKRIVIINIDSRDFYVDGVKTTFSVNPEIKDGRTMLPISEIGKALGMTTGNKGENKNIEWDATLRQVKIQLTK